MTAVSRPPTDDRGQGQAGVVDQVARSVDGTVSEHPWIERLARIGWYAKGLVYLLMGVAAWTVAHHPSTSGQTASPQGALQRVSQTPGGRALLAVLGAGLVLYAVWRLLSVAAMRGRTGRDHLNRVGYTLSGLFYAGLAVTALRSAVRHSTPRDTNTIERLSRRLMANGAGRVVLIVAGVVVLAVGVFFVVKAVTGRYTDNLAGVSDDEGANRGHARLLWWLGLVGWTARGIVTGLVGWFVLRAAWTYDPAEAHGFDGALRQSADTDLGRILVTVVAVGLMVYGLYCVFSAGRRTIAQQGSGLAGRS